MNSFNNTTDDTSAFLDADGKLAEIDLGSLFSSDFSNIKSLYHSESGPTAIFTATRYGKRFVLKGLKEDYLSDPIFNLGLAKEFEIGFSLDHPSIRRTLSLEKIDGLGQVIALEYIDGCSLDSLLRSKSITRENGRRFCREIAEGLAYLHGRQTLHRDLKPSNVLITHQNGAIKIIDFNLSDSDGFIILKNPAGSGKYIAPELRLPEAHATQATDIYSLGVIALEISEVTADKQLKEAARICMDKDPSKRIEGLQMLREGRLPSSAVRVADRLLSSAWLTAAMLTICTALAACIAYHYITL